MMNLIMEIDLLSIPIVGLIVGLLFCFMGRKVLGFVVLLFGFLIGLTWGSPFLYDVLHKTAEGSPWIRWVAGGIGAVLGVVAWRVSMFFAGTVIGLFIARGIIPGINGIVHVVIAFASGFLVHVYKDKVIAFITAMAGGYITSGFVVSLMVKYGFIDTLGTYKVGMDTGFIILIVLTVIFTVVGYLVQTRDVKV